MRVLQLAWEYPPAVVGGLARHVGGLSTALVAGGDEVSVLTRSAAAGPAPSGDDGVRVIRVGWPGSDTFPLEMDRFLRWVAALNEALAAAAPASGVDVVHSHDWLVADAARAVARRLRRPWVVTVHGTEHGRHAGRVADWPQSVVHAAERAMVADADAVTTCSAYMAGHVTDALGAAPERIVVTGNGVDGTTLSAAAARGPELRSALAPGAGPVVLLAGRLVHEKGFHVALKALAGLPGVRGLVAGTGPAGDDLRAQAVRLGLGESVRFLGWVEEATLASLYRAADVCAIPSLYEPFGIVALEAMACGCPCVVSDTGGLREVVPTSGPGAAGVRVPPGDPAALRAALRALLDDAPRRARMARAGPGPARARDWATIASTTRELYGRLLHMDS